MSEQTPIVPMPAPESPTVVSPAVESPPPAARPAFDSGDEPRVALNRLATLLTQQRNTRFLTEYLRLRRLLRS